MPRVWHGGETKHPQRKSPTPTHLNIVVCHYMYGVCEQYGITHERACCIRHHGTL